MLNFSSVYSSFPHTGAGLHQCVLGTRSASIHRVRMCRLVVPTASCVPPNVVPPASRVPPSRHCISCSFAFKIFLVHVPIEVQEIDSCSLFPLVCRPSGFTQNAMRYPPRSPDITIETQAKTTFQSWFLGPTTL